MNELEAKRGSQKALLLSNSAPLSHNGQRGIFPFLWYGTGLTIDSLFLLPEFTIRFVAYDSCNEVAFSSSARLQVTAERTCREQGAIAT